MAGIKLGDTTINKMYLGDTEIKTAYLGSVKVWDTNDSTPITEDSISLSRNSITFAGNDGMEQTITVTASGSWTRSATESWVHCTVDGNSVTISCDTYSGSTYRTAEITFYCGSAHTTLSIRQNASNSISLSDNSPIEFTSNGGSKSITVYSSSNWTCEKQANATWVTVPASGRNGDVITITCAANNTTVDRSTLLEFSCGASNSVMLSVSQSAGLTPSDPTLPDN